MNDIVHQKSDTVGDLQRRIAGLRRQIAAETDCAKAVGLVAMADTIEEAMANAGYRGNTEALRPANEVRFEARWKLGQLLAKMEKRRAADVVANLRCPGPGHRLGPTSKRLASTRTAPTNASASRLFLSLSLRTPSRRRHAKAF